ncbi:SMC-Scp complex subunit ScpB [Bacillus lacus]|uniref:Segregation and condensation protein B n=1 Tax=Metabacillus lacus TaxID=1983721 RepID=A0A7X2IWE8_9BACI|nr:SMC-Scp complex subunit ScpB [Metabacillus lacus]MRX71056.1 SMC-Scp complex subunit ScpB [Metabacillus lacus]
MELKIEHWKGIVEALLFAAGEDGLSVKQLAKVLELEEADIQAVIGELSYDYKHADRGICIKETADIFQLITKRDHAIYLQKLVESNTGSALSQAALETLAIVAYKQPITRVEIEEIRGVKSERPLQTLTGRILIKEVGRAEGTGRPILYGTTREFLEHFGLKNLDELPPLSEGEDNDGQEEADLFFERFQESLEDV